MVLAETEVVQQLLFDLRLKAVEPRSLDTVYTLLVGVEHTNKQQEPAVGLSLVRFFAGFAAECHGQQQQPQRTATTVEQ